MNFWRGSYTSITYCRAEVPNLWDMPPGEALLALGGAWVVCMRDIFILNEIWVQDKIYILVGT
jgi:hypothetical protein